jgi:hypothetical protein
MALDPRIALQGASFQAPDILGAMRQGQEYRQNQMAQQAAQATAARNAMIQQRAASVDFNDRNSVNEFARLGPETTAYIQAAGAGDTLFNTRAAEARAGGEYARKARGEDQGFMQRAIGAVYTDPSNANIAAVSEQAIAAGVPREQMTAYAARILAAPPEQRRSLLANELATTPEGLKLLERFTPAYDMQNAGGSIVPVQTNPLAPGATPPERIAVTASPNRPVIVQTAEGYGSVVPGQSGFTPVTDDQGNPVMPYQAPSAGAAAADETRQNAAEGVRSTIDSMLGYYENLEKMKGIVSTERGPAENIIASIGASLPGRVVGRTIGSREQTERDNIQTAIPMLVASLKDLTGMSAQQMNSNVELQLFLNTVSAPDQSIETVREAFARFGRYVDSVSGSGAQGGGNVSALEAEARRRGLIQ